MRSMTGAPPAARLRRSMRTRLVSRAARSKTMRVPRMANTPLAPGPTHDSGDRVSSRRWNPEQRLRQIDEIGKQQVVAVGRPMDRKHVMDAGHDCRAARLERVRQRHQLQGIRRIGEGYGERVPVRREVWRRITAARGRWHRDRQGVTGVGGHSQDRDWADPAAPRPPRTSSGNPASSTARQVAPR